MDCLDIVTQIKKAGKPVVIYGTGTMAHAFYHIFDRENIEVAGIVWPELNETQGTIKGAKYLKWSEVEARKDDYFIVPALLRYEERSGFTSQCLRDGFKHILVMSTFIEKPVEQAYTHICGELDTMPQLLESLKKEKSVDIYGDGIYANIMGFICAEYGINIKRHMTWAPDAACTERFRRVNNVPLYDLQEVQAEEDEAVLIADSDAISQNNHIYAMEQHGYKRIYFLSKKMLDQLPEEMVNGVLGYSGDIIVERGYKNVEKHHVLCRFLKDNAEYRFRFPDIFAEAMVPYDERQALRTLVLDEYVGSFGYKDFLSYDTDDLSLVNRGTLNIEVYMAKFYRDFEIPGCNLPDWVIPIQGGAALTDVRVAEVTDNTGDNISERNQDYSEGTSMYWMWKNTSNQDYVGLFHYRRHMALDQKSFDKIKNYDAVMTIPTIVPLGIRNFFTYNFVFEFDWEYFMTCIEEYDRSYYETALKYENQHVYFSSNVMIMKREVYDEMCEFSFSILEKLSGFYRDKGLVRNDRWIGFFLENLTSIFLMHNHERLNVALTDMKFYRTEV